MAIDPVSFALYDRDFAGFSRALGAAFERYGFAVVGEHGLEEADVGGDAADPELRERAAGAGDRERWASGRWGPGPGPPWSHGC